MKVSLYIMAILFGLLGAAFFIYAPRYSLLKPSGMILVVLSAYLLRLSGKQKIASIGQDINGTAAVNSTRSKKLEIVVRSLGLVAVVAVVTSYIFLKKDALEGGHQAWPAYAFAVSVLFGAIIWSYLLAKAIFRNR